MSDKDPKGAKCWTQIGKKHYGICTGVGPDGEYWFVHSTREGGVVHTTHKGFAGNREIYVEQYADPSKADAIVYRALSMAGQEYKTLSANCEHMANLAFNGEASSSQVKQGAVLLGGLVAVGLAILNNNGTTTDADGRRRNSRGQFAKRRWV